MKNTVRAATLCALLFVMFVSLSTAAPRAEAGGRHLRLVKSAPDTGSVVNAAPAAIELWFSEAPQIRVTTMRLQSGQTAVELARPEQDTADGKHVSAKVQGSLAAGSYQVTWRTMSRDGHVVNGTFGFTYSP